MVVCCATKNLLSEKMSEKLGVLNK